MMKTEARDTDASQAPGMFFFLCLYIYSINDFLQADYHMTTMAASTNINITWGELGWAISTFFSLSYFILTNYST